VTLGIGHFADDVKCIVLQPFCEIAGDGWRGEEGSGAGEEEESSGVDKRLVLDEGAHGEGGGYAAPEGGVEGFGSGGEERGEAMSIGDGLLDRVEFGLLVLH